MGPSGQFAIGCQVHHQSQDSQPDLGHFSPSHPDTDSTHSVPSVGPYQLTLHSFQESPRKSFRTKPRLLDMAGRGHHDCPPPIPPTATLWPLFTLYPLITLSSSWNPHKGSGSSPTIHSVQNFFCPHNTDRTPVLQKTLLCPFLLATSHTEWPIPELMFMTEFIIKQCHGQPICSPLPLYCELLDN